MITLVMKRTAYDELQKNADHCVIQFLELAEFGTLLVNKQKIIHVKCQNFLTLAYIKKKNLNIYFSRRINKIPVDFQDFQEILKFQ